VKKPFNYDYEVRRKCNLEKFLLRTREQHDNEKSKLEEAKKLEQKIKKEEKEERNLRKLIHFDLGDSIANEPSALLSKRKYKNISVNTTNIPKIGSENLSPLLSPSQGGRGGRRDRGSGVYLRSQRINAPLPISERLTKKLEIALAELGIPDTLLPTATVVSLFDQLRKEILKMLCLQKHITKKENEKRQFEERLKEIENKKKYDAMTHAASLEQVSNGVISTQRKILGPTTTTMNPAGLPLPVASLTGSAGTYKKTLGTMNTVAQPATQPPANLPSAALNIAGTSTPAASMPSTPVAQDKKTQQKKSSDKKQGKRKNAIGVAVASSKRHKK